VYFKYIPKGQSSHRYNPHSSRIQRRSWRAGSTRDDWSDAAPAMHEVLLYSSPCLGVGMYSSVCDALMQGLRHMAGGEDNAGELAQ